MMPGISSKIIGGRRENVGDKGNKTGHESVSLKQGGRHMGVHRAVLFPPKRFHNSKLRKTIVNCLKCERLYIKMCELRVRLH